MLDIKGTLDKLSAKFTKLTGGKKIIGGRKKRSKAAMSFDLLYQLSYMSVIASGGVPRSQIFERAGIVLIWWKANFLCAILTKSLTGVRYD